MDFKNCLSSIFYLTESLKYLESETLHSQVEQNLLQLLDNAYEETHLANFKFIAELRRNFGAIGFPSAVKNSLKKRTCDVIIRQTAIDIETAPLSGQLADRGWEYTDLPAQQCFIGRGDVIVNGSVRTEVTDGQIHSLRFVHVRFNNCAEFDQGEFNHLVNMLHQDFKLYKRRE